MGFSINSNGQVTNTLSVQGGWEVFHDEGITEAVTESGPSATVTFYLNDANDRYSFVNQLLGTWTGTPPNNIVYTGPYAYQPSPNLICTSVPSIRSVHGTKKVPLLGLGLPWIWSKAALVTAVFTRPSWQASSTGQGYFSISFQGSGENLDIPETTYRFGDGTPTNTPVGLLVPHASITVTRYRMPFIPDAYAMQLLGFVNANPFSIGWNTYAAGTLLFAGINSEVQSDPNGNVTYTVGYQFQFRSQPWNYLYHPNRTTGWSQVTDGNGNSLYQTGDFETLP